jgi:hypothetical protein
MQFVNSNLDRFNMKYGNVLEEFRNTECILSQEFRSCNTKYGNLSQEFWNT